MPQSQKQYSNNARVHYTVHNQPTHTHNPTPQQRSRTTGQATRAHYPRTPTACHPHTHTSTHRDTHHQQTTTTTTAATAHHHSGRVSYTNTDNQPHPRATNPRDTTSCPFSAGTAPQPAQTHQQPRQPRPGSHPHTIPILRKEVIQPHLPVRLPCYDFVPIANPTFDHSPHQTVVRPWASGVTNFHDVTGGVYKARERIHRSIADLRLLATPTSWGRVADPNPN